MRKNLRNKVFVFALLSAMVLGQAVNTYAAVSGGQASWKYEGQSWKCYDASGKTLTGWQWIDGYCYYFNAADGVMCAGQATPDGYLTDAQGRWIESDGTVHYEVGKGISTSAHKGGSVDGVSGSTSSSRK